MCSHRHSRSNRRCPQQGSICWVRTRYLHPHPSHKRLTTCTTPSLLPSRLMVFAFRIGIGVRKSYLLSAANDLEADAWVEAINRQRQPPGRVRDLWRTFHRHRLRAYANRDAVVQRALRHFESLATSSADVPQGLRFNEATTCALCLNTFTTRRRRHHCRLCGASVCAACCPERRSPSNPFATGVGDAEAGTHAVAYGGPKATRRVRACRACCSALNHEWKARQFRHAVETAQATHPEVNNGQALAKNSTRSLACQTCACRLLSPMSCKSATGAPWLSLRSLRTLCR